MSHSAALSGSRQGKCLLNIEEYPGGTYSVPASSMYAHVCTCAHVYVLVGAHTMGAGMEAFCVEGTPGGST